MRSWLRIVAATCLLPGFVTSVNADSLQGAGQTVTGIAQVSQTGAGATDASSSLRIDRPDRTVIITGAGQNVEEVFSLSNDGLLPLNVEIERTSCGCISALLSSKVVAPGAKQTLTFKMIANGWGVKEESVYLRVNGSVKSQTVLTVRATTPPTVIVNPNQVVLETGQGEATDQFLSLLMPDGASLKAVRVGQPFLATHILGDEPVTGGKAYRVSLSVLASAPAGEYKDNVIFELENAPVKHVSVPVQGTVRNNIQCLPGRLFLGDMAPGDSKTKILIVQSHKKEVFSIRSIQCASAAISAFADSSIIANSHAVEVKIRAADKSGALIDEKLTISLSNGQVLSVPIIGRMSSNSMEALRPAAMPRVGYSAPDFSSTDMNGNEWELSALRDRKNVLLTFFPRCFTGGCAGQLASLQKELPHFTAANTQIIAVSVDPANNQLKFAASLGLEFPLIPDVSRKLCLLYGSVSDMQELSARQSILIDKQGIVRYIDTDVHVTTHGADMLAKMRELGMTK